MHREGGWTRVSQTEETAPFVGPVRVPRTDGEEPSGVRELCQHFSFLAHTGLSKAFWFRLSDCYDLSDRRERWRGFYQIVRNGRDAKHLNALTQYSCHTMNSPCA